MITAGSFRLTLLAVIMLVLGLCGNGMAAQKNAQVLVLNSYHHGFKWTDDIVDGIRSQLKSNAELRIEYMDSRRIFSKEYLRKLADTYRVKFKGTRYDAIIVTDDPALELMLDLREELFGETPVVFCGINNFDDSRLRGKRFYTGVEEDFDIQGTLDIAHKLHPKARRVIALVNSNATGIANRQLLEAVRPVFRDIFDVEIVTDPELGSFIERVKSLPKDEYVILLAGRFRDAAGAEVPLTESTPLIAASGVPSYSLWEFYLGHGIIGGRLTNGFYQGKVAGEMTRRVLAGEISIPVVRESPNEYMFDFRELSRFGINPGMLPPNSRIINKPVSFYERNRTTVQAVAAVAISLSVVILVLGVTIRNKNRAQLELSDYKNRLEELVAERTGELNEKAVQLQQSLVIAEDALAKVKQLEGIIPICMYCKKINDDKENWQQLESYISSHSEAQFSHGVCPQCAMKYWGRKQDSNQAGEKDFS